MTLAFKMKKFYIRNKIAKKRTDSLNQFLNHIYKELKINQTTLNDSKESVDTNLSNTDNEINDNISCKSNASLYTAKNSDGYLDNLDLKQNGFYVKKSNNENEFNWECSCYLKLLDNGFTPQIMFANKESLKIVYDTRHFVSLNSVLKSYKNSNYVNESSFSLFLHDLFSFISSLNTFVLHNSLSLENVFYDSLSSKFYVTDLQRVILKTSTEEYVSDTTSHSSTAELLKDYSDLICLHKLLLSVIDNVSLLKMINRIFICYIPVDFVKLYYT